MTEFFKRNTIVFVYFALFLSTLLVYWQVRNFDFTNYDDNDYIYENPDVLNGLTKSAISWAFTAYHSANWHPLTWLSHMLDCQLFGKNPGRMHLVNLFLHLANTFLLFTVLRKMTDSTPSTSSGQASSPQAAALWQSAFVAAAFALHPMHVESVAWIVERKDVLSTLFWLLTILAYAGYVKCGTGFQPVQARPGWPCYIAAIIFFALGLMSKPMLVTLPFILLLIDYWPLNRFLNSKFSILNSIIEKIPFFVLAAVSSVITFLAQRTGGAIAGLVNLTLKDRIANAFLSYARYIGKLFWPQDLAVFYPFDANGFPYLQIVLYALLLLSLSILAIYFGRKHRYLPVGWFWFVGTLVPVIGLVQVGAQAYADRYTYIPYIGLFIMLAWGLPELLSKWPHRKVALGISAVLVIMALGAAAFRQVGVWKDSIALFSHAVKVTQNNAFAHNNLGGAYLDVKRYQDALESCNQAVRINPGLTEAYANLGVAYEKLGRRQDSVENYKLALRIKPDWAEAHCRLGAVYGSMGSFQDALEMYKQAVKIDPASAEAHNGLGAVCLDLGRYQESIESLKQAITLKPDYIDAYYNLGVAFKNTGRWQESLDAFKQAISFKPDYADAYYNLGVVFGSIGNYQQAIESYKHAIGIKPDFAGALYNLGVACGILGRYQDAVDSFKQAVRVKPDYSDAHYNLGVTFLIIGDRDLALEEYKILKTLDAKQADRLYNLIRQK